MRVGQLLGARVIDAQGRKIGHVFEIEAVQSGPVVSESMGQALQIRTLLVGARGLFVRFGYKESRLARGPMGLITKPADGYAVAWAEIEEIGRRVIRLSKQRGELTSLGGGGAE